MSNRFFQRSLIDIEDLHPQEIDQCLQLASQLKQTAAPNLLAQRIIANCFFEASTRTRLSFDVAIQRLGGKVVGFDNAGQTSLAQKGESLADTITVLSHYVDAIVMRHPQAGACALAQRYSRGIPIINAGDGANQHPTQTLLDLFSIQESQQRLTNLNIALVGDLKYGRTVHSLAKALCHFPGNRLFFISPDELAMPSALLHHLDNANLAYSQHQQWHHLIPQLDIIYMTRLQTERSEQVIHYPADIALDPAALQTAKTNLKILHPLPRGMELPVAIDDLPYAYYFQQAANGVFVRQALLALILNHELSQ